MKRVSGPSSPIVAWAVLCLACGPGVQEGPVPERTEPYSIDTDETHTDLPSTDSADTETSDGGTIGGETDSGSDTGRDTGSDTGSDTGQDWCPSDTITEPEALTANQVLSSGVLVAVDAGCVLAARQEATGYTAAAAFLSADVEDKVVFRSEYAVPLRPRAVACRYDLDAQTATAYIVTADDTQGIVYELTSVEGQWREIFRGARLFGVQQMYRTAEPKVDELCVFGDGVFCAAGGAGWTDWREELPAGTGFAVRDMALVACDEGRCLAAVGDAGFVAVKQQSVWQPVVIDTAADLTAISVIGIRFSVVGTGGTFLYGNAAGLVSYSILDGQDIVSLSWYGTRSFKGATANGAVFEGEMQSDGVYICPNAAVVSPGLLGGDFFNCGDATNYLVLHPDALIGEFECVVIVIS